MKITVYCDKEGVLRYNPKGWPNNPSFDLGPKPSGIDYEIMDDLSEAYTTALEKAKSDSVPFEDQDVILFLISESLSGPLIDLLNLTKPDSFYEIEIIQLDHLIHQRGESYHSNPISAARIPKALS